MRDRHVPRAPAEARRRERMAIVNTARVKVDRAKRPRLNSKWRVGDVHETILFMRRRDVAQVRHRASPWPMLRAPPCRAEPRCIGDECEDESGNECGDVPR
jgi:hypothetical protein